MLRRCIVAFILVLAGSAVVRADPPIPALTGRVVDEAHILDQGTIAGIARDLDAYEQATTNQVVVVTLPSLQSYPIEDWGLALGRGWAIGQKDKDNGVLLIVAPNDRQVRIEVGYGLEGQLPDATADQIIRAEIIPHFKSGDFPGGVRAGVTAILAALGGHYDASKSDTGSGSSPFVPFIMVGLCVVIFTATRLRRKWDPVTRRQVWYWRDDMGRSGGSGAGFVSGGGGGFSSGGGGGFSGGGGSFGGGGASGRW